MRPEASLKRLLDSVSSGTLISPCNLNNITVATHTYTRAHASPHVSIRVHTHTCIYVYTCMMHTHTHTHVLRPTAKGGINSARFQPISLSLMPHGPHPAGVHFPLASSFQSRPLIWESISLKWSHSLQSLVYLLELVSQPCFEWQSFRERVRSLPSFQADLLPNPRVPVFSLKPSTGPV